MKITVTYNDEIALVPESVWESNVLSRILNKPKEIECEYVFADDIDYCEFYEMEKILEGARDIYLIKAKKAKEKKNEQTNE